MYLLLTRKTGIIREEKIRTYPLVHIARKSPDTVIRLLTRE